ncbi:Lrp/AsnC family leucine-responsive transcriptional regulator [Saccharopolyspora gloriosae]|uniref:Lrp/AsnC family leucine-responsive transcriptional regulator n=1 Tax=Saccharopolyspora gloriosae TaxID=455344 RepID=A0A840NLP1_9PSEU|nr:Lrp/AsnC family transcriptional regulator [Saccharopolyspora gloriosae]MBB5070199.1 Lrp/AsnC family leucine-responsive transcriptional regulator [Saccharopolyspora gloriosae]
MDSIDLALLADLQRDGRTSHAELARRVGLSAPAVAERLRRLERTGVITGYAVRLDPAKLGFGIVAFIRLAAFGVGYRDEAVQDLLRLPEVMETHHVVGEDCWIFKVAVPDVGRLESVLSKMTEVGRTTTSIVLSSPVTDNTLPLTPES